MDVVIAIASLAGFILLTASTGLFVAIEFALTGLEKSTVEAHERARGDAPARAVSRAFSHLSFVLSGAQLGITITTLATGYLAEPLLATYVNPLLMACGLSPAAAETGSMIVALIIATVLSMVFGELVPKNIAITMPLPVARAVTRPVQAFNLVFSWFIRFLSFTANWVVRKMGIEPADELVSARSPQELGSLVRNSVESGGLDATTAEVLEASLEFGHTTAEELMTPRSTVDVLQADDTVDQLISLAIETGHSRFPVVDGDLDETLGVVHVKDAFRVPRAQRSTLQLGDLALPIPAVPESLDGDAVLKAVRSAGSQLVLVADEYGGTAGIVTIEDVVEEILGEVYDEHDDEAAEQDFLKQGTSWLVTGLARLDDVADELGYQAPDGPYETLGGLVMATLGRIPAAGDTVVLPRQRAGLLDDLQADPPGRWLAQVTLMDDRRVDKVALSPISEEQAKEYQQ